MDLWENVSARPNMKYKLLQKMKKPLPFVIGGHLIQSAALLKLIHSSLQSCYFAFSEKKLLLFLEIDICSRK